MTVVSRSAALSLCLLLPGVFAVGCASDRPGRSATRAAMFEPVDCRMHRVFTQIKDWTGDEKPDGIECLIELQDSFGDSTKSSGSVLFELFEYDPNSPDTRGVRVVNPWQASLDARLDQELHWNRTSRCYEFQLAYPQIDAKKQYVLRASFQPPEGRRLFDQLVIGGK